MRSTMKPMTILVTLILAMICAASSFAQTCNSAIVATTPTSRFVNNDNGTVTDKATGLVWKRCSEGQNWDGTTCTGIYTLHDWQSALQAGSDAVFAGESDWRLPNKNELASLVESQCITPAINTTIFPATPAAALFWSSSPYAGAELWSSEAWSVSFIHGTVRPSSMSQGDMAVRFVRGG